MVDLPVGGRGNGAICRKALPALCDRRENRKADERSALSQPHSEWRFRKGNRRLGIASSGRIHDRSEKFSEIWPDRGTLYGFGPSGRSRAYWRHLSLDEAKRERPELLLSNDPGYSTGQALFAKNVFLRLRRLDPPQS